MYKQIKTTIKIIKIMENKIKNPVSKKKYIFL